MPASGEITIRNACRADLDEIMRIDSQSYPDAWTANDFLRTMQCRNSYLVAVNVGKETVAFCAYYYFNHSIQIDRMAVCPLHRRELIGSFIVNKLVDKLTAGKYTAINCELRESNVRAQLFFRSLKFVTSKTIRKFYDDTGEDAYQFSYCLSKLKNSVETVNPTYGGVV